MHSGAVRVHCWKLVGELVRQCDANMGALVCLLDNQLAQGTSLFF